MSDWSTLPLLPLRCILDYLSPEDAVKAMSTCRHWRNAVLLYEGRRDTLKLNIKQLEKCKFLACLFKKNVRRLHLYIDCNEPEIEKFMNLVFPLFFDTSRLQELLFIGPSYVQQSNHVPFIKLRRIQIESLIYKNTLSLQKLGFMGCSLGTPKNENERQHNAVEHYSRALKFDCVPSPADKILTRANQCVMQFTKIRHIIADIDQINTSSLETLSGLSNLRYLSINITNRKLPDPYHSIDWVGLEDFYETPLRVAVNIIGVPYRRFDDIIQKILVEGMTLISLKVMFCKSLYTPLITHVSRLYQSSLREVMWVDSPYDSTDPYHRIVRPVRHNQADTHAHVNPFVLMCWQCASLQRLVIHGYWIWQYDVLGFVRLRKDLRHLEVSAIYYRQDRFQNFINSSEEGAIRVLCCDSPPPVDAAHIREVNEFTEYPWIPTRWSELHPALRARASSLQRADFVLRETRDNVGVADGSRRPQNDW